VEKGEGGGWCCFVIVMKVAPSTWRLQHVCNLSLYIINNIDGTVSPGITK
jgi:hypothetical protein